MRELPKTLQELFSDADRWTKRCPARDKNGVQCFYDSEEAECWCLAGGAQLIYPNILHTIFKKIRRAADKIGINTEKAFWYSDWNDDKNTSILDVQALVKEAGV